MKSSVIAFVVVAYAGTVAAGETARQILDRRKQLDETTQRWEDRYQKMSIRIFDGRGGERGRKLEFYERKYPDDERKSIMFLRAPAEVRGVGFLSHTHKGRSADQWLYLSELQRVRKISAQTRNERFVATDLTYHDLDIIAELPSWSEDDARSQLRGEETLEGVPCHVIELTPKREDVGYRRIVMWLGRDDLVARKLELYSDDSQPTKRLTLSDVRAVAGIPVAHRVDVEARSAGTRTEIEITSARFNDHLEDDLFTQRALEQGGR